MYYLLFIDTKSADTEDIPISCMVDDKLVEQGLETALSPGPDDTLTIGKCRVPLLR